MRPPRVTTLLSTETSGAGKSTAGGRGLETLIGFHGLIRMVEESRLFRFIQKRSLHHGKTGRP